MDDRQLLAAAELARRNEVWDRAIGTADRTVLEHDFSVRYLAPYRELLAEQARTRELEEPWVLGVIRQESRFITGARSSTGATGLMQVMRNTARWVVQRTHMKGFSWTRLSDPSVNAALGTYYLRHVLDQFDGNPVVAAAAYNAGPSRARQWRGTEPIEGAIFAETIPFGETRDYVKKVMANFLLCCGAWRRGDAAQGAPGNGCAPSGLGHRGDAGLAQQSLRKKAGGEEHGDTQFFEIMCFLCAL
jgi:soluble lytic murein transglycosylase